MLFSLAPPRRVERVERIDTEEASDADFEATFTDIARINRYLGGTRALLRALTPLARAVPAGQSLRILDIATGSADIPRALVDEARRGSFGTGRTLDICATDHHPRVLALAQRRTCPLAYREIRIVSADAFCLPFADGTFDFALCSLAFHHFGPENCVHVLREMERVSLRGFVVNDLLRNRRATALIWAATRTLGAHPMTCHDAPVSVMRAFTLAEYAEMACLADLPQIAIRPAPLYRAVLIRDKQQDFALALTKQSPAQRRFEER